MYDDNHRPGTSEMRRELRHIISAWACKGNLCIDNQEFAKIDSWQVDSFYDEAAELIFAVVDNINRGVTA